MNFRQFIDLSTLLHTHTCMRIYTYTYTYKNVNSIRRRVQKKKKKKMCMEAKGIYEGKKQKKKRNCERGIQWRNKREFKRLRKGMRRGRDVTKGRGRIQYKWTELTRADSSRGRNDGRKRKREYETWAARAYHKRVSGALWMPTVPVARIYFSLFFVLLTLRSLPSRQVLHFIMLLCSFIYIYSIYVCGYNQASAFVLHKYRLRFLLQVRRPLREIHRVTHACSHCPPTLLYTCQLNCQFCN